MKVERANYLLGKAIAGFQDDEINDFVSAFEEIDDPDFEIAGGKRGTRLLCMECGHKFRRKLGPRTIGVKCSECGSDDTEIA